MRKTATLALLIFAFINASAQNKKVDSLVNLLRSADGERRLKVLKELAHDSSAVTIAIKYGQEGFALAKKMNRPKDEEAFLLDLAHGYNLNYNYPKELETTLLGLEISNKINDDVYKCWFANGIALSYRTGNELNKAINYGLLGLHFARKIKDQQRISQLSYNISDFYMYVNRLDSALAYMKESYAAGLRINSSYISYPILGLGDIENKMNHPNAALNYYHRAIESCISRNDVFNTNNLGRAYESIAIVEQKQDHIDSALYYASKSYDLAQHIGALDEVFKSGKTLSELYAGKDDLKSLRYYKISSIAHDSVLNEAKARQFQIVAANQQHKETELKDAEATYRSKLKIYGLLGVLTLVLSIAGILWNSYKKQQAINKLLVKQQNELKATQNQLIQSEKMASLGELTAGIAHEIQNPLNFVNNFSEVNKEMLEELKAESKKSKAERDEQLETELINGLIENEGKINHHGKRADSIVKGMLQHSQSGSGAKEPTNINALADEYMRLSYHGLRAKDKSFNAEMISHFDPELPKINVVQQDIGRVLLNLFNNAFYAVHEKQKTAGSDYKAEVAITTLTENNHVIIKVKDNGSGIPEHIKDKIMQPFFTTKPTGEGTGLGLSLSYDIVVKGHGGNITIESVENEHTTFTVILTIS